MNDPHLSPQRTAIIGAGMAGLACATRLAEAGAVVTLFEKGRRPGGRLATRRAGGGAFDHGAQYATARKPGLAGLMAALQSGGHVAPWPAAQHGDDIPWVGVPGMSAIGRAMETKLTALGVAIHTERHVAWLHDNGTIRHLPATEARPGSTQNTGGDMAGPFDAIVLAVPAPQAVPLLATRGQLFKGRLDDVSMAPCWAVMAVFDEPVVAADVIRPSIGALSWIARDSARPGHAGTPDCWVLHAGAAWSHAHLEDDPADVTRQLLDAFGAATGSTVAPRSTAAHRWRYALVETPLGAPFLWDQQARIGVCGDWCLGPRVEAAFDSGTALADAVLATR